MSHKYEAGDQVIDSNGQSWTINRPHYAYIATNDVTSDCLLREDTIVGIDASTIARGQIAYVARQGRSDVMVINYDINTNKYLVHDYRTEVTYKIDATRIKRVPLTEQQSEYDRGYEQGKRDVEFRASYRLAPNAPINPSDYAKGYKQGWKDAQDAQI